MEFQPKVGDKVFFSSDRQTEAGPSEGSVAIVEGRQVAIRHSDKVEWFQTGKLSVKSFRTRPNFRHWTFF